MGEHGRGSYFVIFKTHSQMYCNRSCSKDRPVNRYRAILKVLWNRMRGYNASRVNTIVVVECGTPIQPGGRIITNQSAAICQIRAYQFPPEVSDRRELPIQVF